MEAKDLQVLYEDNQIIVAIKPQNGPSQEDSSGDKDMLSMIKEYVKEKYNKPGEAFIGLVHRLDRPTGGIMVFARNSKSAARLSEQIRQNQMHKTYYCVAVGTLKDKEATLVNYLKKDEKENIVKIVPISESGAKKAELKYKILQTEGNLSLCQVNLISGRSHQIRVQFAGINCPLFGDKKYGKFAAGATDNLGLWAGRLEFMHPTTKQKMIFACPPDTSKMPWKNFYLDKYFLR